MRWLVRTIGRHRRARRSSPVRAAPGARTAIVRATWTWSTWSVTRCMSVVRLAAPCGAPSIRSAQPTDFILRHDVDAGPTQSFCRDPFTVDTDAAERAVVDLVTAA